MPGDADLVLVLTTEADQERAEAMARVLLERRLAACVALRPILSLYHWEGHLECSPEVQLLIKTRASHLGALEQAVRALHSYETPEWIHWPARCSETYGAWLVESVSSPR
ncbi:MAG: divalent-cation tolerance protein CutA [Synechococcaceae cyanobacterium]